MIAALSMVSGTVPFIFLFIIVFPIVVLRYNHNVDVSIVALFFRRIINRFIPRETGIFNLGIKKLLPGEPILLIKTSSPNTLLFDKKLYVAFETYFTLLTKSFASRSVVLTI